MIRRTSTKTLGAALVFFVLYFCAGRLAEQYYLSTNPIDFGVDFVRQWNPWDYVSYGSLLIFVSLTIVSLMFLDKDD